MVVNLVTVTQEEPSVLCKLADNETLHTIFILQETSAQAYRFVFMYVYLGASQRMDSVNAEPTWWEIAAVNQLLVTSWPLLISISMKLKMLFLWTPDVPLTWWVITMEIDDTSIIVNCIVSHIGHDLQNFGLSLSCMAHTKHMADFDTL